MSASSIRSKIADAAASAFRRAAGTSVRALSSAARFARAACAVSSKTAAFALHVASGLAARTFGLAATAQRSLKARYGRFAYLAFKASVLIFAALLVTLISRAYLFQRIMSEEIIKQIGKDASADGVRLGLSQFSFDSVAISELRRDIAGVVELGVREMEFSYDFWESMRSNAIFTIVSLKKPVLKVNEIKAALLLLVDACRNCRFPGGSRIPSISLSEGRILYRDREILLDRINCEIAQLTDSMINVVTTASFKYSNCSIKTVVSVDLHERSVRIAGSVRNAAISRAETIINGLAGRRLASSAAISGDIDFTGGYSFNGSTGAVELSFIPSGVEFRPAAAPGIPVTVNGGRIDARLEAGANGLSYSATLKSLPVAIAGIRAIADGRAESSGSDITISAPNVSPEIIAALSAIPEKHRTAISALPGLSISANYKDGGLTVNAASTGERAGKALAGVSIGSASAWFLIENSGRTRLEARLNASAPWMGSRDISIAAENASDIKFQIDGIGNGSIDAAAPGGTVNASFAGTSSSLLRDTTVSLSSALGESGEFTLRITNADLQKIAGAILGRQAENALKKKARFDAGIRGVFDARRIVCGYSITPLASPSKRTEGSLAVSGFGGAGPLEIKAISRLDNLSHAFLNAGTELIDRLLPGSECAINITDGADGIAATIVSGEAAARFSNGELGATITAGPYAVNAKYRPGTGTAEFFAEAAGGLHPAAAALGLRKFHAVAVFGASGIVSVKGNGEGESAFLAEVRLSPDGAARSPISITKLEYSSPLMAFSGDGRFVPVAGTFSLRGGIAMKDAAPWLGPVAAIAIRKEIRATFERNAAGEYRFAAETAHSESATTLALTASADAAMKIKSADLRATDAGKKEFLKISAVPGDSGEIRIDYSAAPLKLAAAAAGTLPRGEWPAVRLAAISGMLSTAALRGSATMRNFGLVANHFELDARSVQGIELSAAFDMDGSPLRYTAERFNHTLLGTTVRAGCEFDLAARTAVLKGTAARLPADGISSLIFGREGIVTGDLAVKHETRVSPVGITLKADCTLTDSRIDVVALQKAIGAKKNTMPPVDLDLRLTVAGTSFVTTPDLNAQAGGTIELGGDSRHPSVSGALEIVRGRINYFNKQFNITSGRFTLSTLRRVEAAAIGGSRQQQKPSAADAPEGRNYIFSLREFNAAAHESETGAGNASKLEVYTDISATAKVSEYDINLTLSGNSARMNSYLATKPELSQEAIHMLLYGIAPTAAAGSRDDSITSTKVIDALNSKVQDTIYQRLSTSLEKKLNLDELDINPYKAYEKGFAGRDAGRGGEAAKGQLTLPSFTDVQVKIGKYLDPSLYLSFSKNLHSAKEDTLGMEYKVRQKLFIDGKVNQNLEYRLGARYGIPF